MGVVALSRTWKTLQWPHLPLNEKWLPSPYRPITPQLFQGPAHLYWISNKLGLVQIFVCINLSLETTFVTPKGEVCQPQLPHLMSQVHSKWAAWMWLWELLIGQALVSICLLGSHSAYHLVSVSPQRLFHICLIVKCKILKENAMWKFCVKCLQHRKTVSRWDNDSHFWVCPLCPSREPMTVTGRLITWKVFTAWLLTKLSGQLLSWWDCNTNWNITDFSMDPQSPPTMI